MNARPTLIVALAVVGTLAAVPADAGLDWFGLHLGPGGVGLSLGFGSWWVHADSWDAWDGPLDYDVALSGYGEWVWVGGLGRVWRPWVAADWRPYTHGRWVWTHLGWTWVAYEPWGYFPHHYGSWALASAGWVWVPGYDYTPANVVWLTAGSRVGWYACPPRGWSHASRGFWHGYSHGRADGYRDGYNDGWRDARYASFVGWDRFGDESVSRHAVVGSAVPRSRSATVLAGPPSRDDVVRRGGRPVPEARLTERAMRIGDRTVTVVRPEGVARSVERHAPETVSRALRPDVARRLESARSESARTRPQARPDSPAASGRRSSDLTKPDTGSGALRGAPSPTAPRTRSDRARRATPPSADSSSRGGAARIQPAPSPQRVEARRSNSAAEIGTLRTPSTTRSRGGSAVRPRTTNSEAARSPQREASTSSASGRSRATARRSPAVSQRGSSADRSPARSETRRHEATSRTRDRAETKRPRR